MAPIPPPPLIDRSAPQRWRVSTLGLLGVGLVLALLAAVRDAQPLELRVNAHAAKGAALNLGLSGLAATAAALHEGAAHLPAHEIARLVQRFESQLPQTRQAVAALNLASRG